jgi:hypothetical protein
VTKGDEPADGRHTPGMRRTTVSRVALYATAVVALTACSQAEALTPQAAGLDLVTAPTPDALRTVDVPPELAVSIDDPVPEVAGPPASGATSMPWAFISQDGAQLRIAYIAGNGSGDGACTRLHGIQTAETDTSVSLTVWSTTDLSQTACASMLVTGSGTVTLDAPLGDRPLVHPPLSGSWAQLTDQLPE